MEITSRQEARIDFRCKPEEKSLIEEASVLLGMTTSSYQGNPPLISSKGHQISSGNSTL